MTTKTNMRRTAAILIPAALLQGCAFQSFLFDTEPNRGGFVITKPPIQFIYRGDFTPESEAFALEALSRMEKHKFQHYKFNENINVRLNSISGKSDKIKIQLNEVAGMEEKPNSSQQVIEGME